MSSTKNRSSTALTSIVKPELALGVSVPLVEGTQPCVVVPTVQ